MAVGNQGSAADEQVARAIEDLIKKELSVDAAVQIALLNNQQLQATYEDLGITQADVVESGLLENPVFFGQARFPDKSPSMTNLEFEVTQNFLNILMLPARKKLAAMQFEEVKLRVADDDGQGAIRQHRNGRDVYGGQSKGPPALL